jgi:hypothetical protein
LQQDRLLPRPCLRTHSKRPHLSVVKFLKNKVLITAYSVLRYFALHSFFPDISLSRFVSEAEQKIMHEYFPCVKQDWGNISKNRIFFENNFKPFIKI